MLKDSRSYETQLVDAVRSVNRALGGTYGTSPAIYKNEFNQFEVQLVDAVKGIGRTLSGKGGIGGGDVTSDQFNDLSRRVKKLEDEGGGSIVTISDLLTSGTKIATITIDETDYDVYTPGGGGGGGSTVSWGTPSGNTIPLTVDGTTNTLLTSFTETDPTVPSWAKASSKPSYTFSELTSHPTTLSGYGITDAATSTQYTALSDRVTALEGWELPIASASTLGGVKVGSGLTIDATTGVLSATGGGGGGGSIVSWGTPSGDTIPLTVDGVTKSLLTSFTETDPTVPSWAKASSKPSYTFSEIGSKPTTLSGYGITDAVTSTQFTVLSNRVTVLESWSLPTASSSTLGGIKVGAGLTIDGSGVLSATGGSGVVMDDTVTQDSANPVKSSGIYSFVTGRRWVGTQAQYDALSTYDNNVEYLITES